MTKIPLQIADRVVDRALEKGRELGLAPLTVAVVDSGGHLVALKREDESGFLRVEIATGKAWGALGMGFNTRELAARAQAMPAFFSAISATSGGRVIPVAGGVLIVNGGYGVIGAVGVSGDTSDNDELCCVAGIEGAGLTYK